jgi:hypothetical protein
MVFRVAASLRSHGGLGTKLLVFATVYAYALVSPSWTHGQEVRRVLLEDFTYERADVREYMRILDAYCTGVREAGWRDSGAYVARRLTGARWQRLWGTPGESVGEDGEVNWNVLRKLKEERHFVRLSAFSEDKDERRIGMISLLAQLHPVDKGWTAEVRYAFPQSYHQHEAGWAFDFEVQYQPAGADAPFGGLHFALSQHLSMVSHRVTYDGTEYYATIKIDEEHSTQIQATDCEVARWYATPESFRDTAFERLDMLNRKTRPGIASGAAIRSTPASTPRSRRLTEAEKEAIINSMEGELGRRRDFIRENYADIHEALVRAFPLADALGPK